MSTREMPFMRYKLSGRLVILAALTFWCLVLVSERPPLSAQKSFIVPSYASPRTPELRVGISPQVTACDSAGRPVNARWSSSDQAVGAVSNSGMLVAREAGRATIPAQVKNQKAETAITVGASASDPAGDPSLFYGSPFLPFGPKGMDVDTIGLQPFTGAHLRASHSVGKLREAMRAARQHGFKLFIRLTGGKERFQNPDGSFSLGLWKKDLNLLRGFDFGPYVADGTVVGAELINEPNDTHNWGGTIVSKADLEAAAAYAKSIWPTLPVGAGRSDYVLKYAPWEHLDFSHSQYAKRKGDVEAWLRQTVGEAKAAGVGLVLSLNFAGKAPMTAQEILYYGSALAKETYPCMLTGYQYDAAYLAQPGMMDAFHSVAAIASSHPAPPCYVGTNVKP